MMAPLPIRPWIHAPVAGRKHILPTPLLPVNSEMGKKCADLGFTHILRMPFIVKQDKTFGPVHIGLLGTDTVVTDADRAT